MLKIIHGIPRGTTEEVPREILECPNVKLEDLQNFILKASPKTTEKNTINLTNCREACSVARRDGDIRMEVRIFLATLLTFSPFTTSSLYLTRKSLEYVLDMKEIATTDWCKLLFDHLIHGIQNFQKSMVVWSPVSFLVSIFEISFLF